MLYCGKGVKNMNKIELTTLPSIAFAHSFSAEKYRNTGFDKSPTGIEVSYIVQGELTIKVNDEKFAANQGDILCVFHHSHTSVDAPRFHCHHTVNALVEWKTSPTDGWILPPVTKACDLTKEIEKLIDLFIYQSYEFERQKTQASLNFMKILSLVDEANKTEQNRRSDGELLAIRAKKYVHEHIEQPVVQAKAAAFLNVTPQYLCSVFKQSEGISFMRYVNTMKLRSIKAIMEKENMKLYEASRLFGYSDPNYVSVLYKKLFGVNITDK